MTEKWRLIKSFTWTMLVLIVVFEIVVMLKVIRDASI